MGFLQSLTETSKLRTSSYKKSIFSFPAFKKQSSYDQISMKNNQRGYVFQKL